MLKSVQAKVSLEEEEFEVLDMHLRATNIELGRFLSVLLLSRITEMAYLGILAGTSEDSAQRPLSNSYESNLSSSIFSSSNNLKAEDLVDLGAEVHPAFYQAQIRVIGTARQAAFQARIVD